jgi:hypothetical protein
MKLYTVCRRPIPLLCAEQVPFCRGGLGLADCASCGGQFAAPNDDARLPALLLRSDPIQFALLFSQKTAVAGFMR